MKRIFTLALALTMALIGTAHADTSTAVNSPTAMSAVTSPVQVSKTFIVTTNRDSISWVTCLNFTNTSQKEMQAIQFGFTYKDAFEEPVADFHADRVGDFAPGVLIEGPDNASDYLTYGNDRKAENCFVYPTKVGSVSAVDVKILKVRYSDGTIWVNPGPVAVFTGQYMFNAGDHPAKIQCAWFMKPMDWSYVQDHFPKCIANYYKAHPQPQPSPAIANH